MFLIPDKYLSTLSFVLSVISIISVVVTIRQNNKILEEANRPYITIFFDSIVTTSRNNFFVLKNFGSTSGTITKFIFTDELSTSFQGHALLNEQFDCIKGMVLAPGQRILLPYDVGVLKTDSIRFEITYQSNFSSKIYTETLNIDVKKRNHMPVSRLKKESAEENFESVLINILNDMSEKNL